MDGNSNIDSDLYLLVAAVLHMTHEVRQRLDGDLRSHPIEPILLHLVATTSTLTELADPTNANNPLYAKRDRLAPGADRSSLAANADDLHDCVDHARVAWSAFCRTAEHDINATELEERLADLEISLDRARTSARAIHDQFADCDASLAIDIL